MNTGLIMKVCRIVKLFRTTGKCKRRDSLIILSFLFFSSCSAGFCYFTHKYIQPIPLMQETSYYFLKSGLQTLSLRQPLDIFVLECFCLAFSLHAVQFSGQSYLTKDSSYYLHPLMSQITLDSSPRLDLGHK